MICRDHVWNNGGLYVVQGVSMIDLLFNAPICSEVINAFLYILTSDDYRAMHNITMPMGYLSVFSMVIIYFKRMTLSVNVINLSLSCTEYYMHIWSTYMFHVLKFSCICHRHLFQAMDLVCECDQLIWFMYWKFYTYVLNLSITCTEHFMHMSQT